MRFCSVIVSVGLVSQVVIFRPDLANQIRTLKPADHCAEIVRRVIVIILDNKNTLASNVRNCRSEIPAK